MKLPQPQPEWPNSWHQSLAYDMIEVFGAETNRGYAYAYELRRSTALNLIASVLKPGSSVIDLAAAQGNFSLTLAEQGFRVTWNDLRAELAGYVRLKYERGLVTYAPGNAFELGFDELFDAALITEVIEHVAHPDDFLRRVAAMVRPGGYIIMTTPNGAYFKNPLPRFSECADPSRFEAGQFKPNADGHIFLLWPDEVYQMAKCANLELVRHMLFTSPLTNGHLKTEILLRWLPRRWIFAIERAVHLLPLGLRKRALTHSASLFQKPG